MRSGADELRTLGSNARLDSLPVAGKSLFAEALHAGTMQGFFKLIEQFRYAAVSSGCHATAWHAHIPCFHDHILAHMPMSNLQKHLVCL